MISKRVLLTLSALLVIFLIYFNKEVIINLLNKNNFIPKEESITELYFEDHLLLPKQIVPDKKYSFKFTVHNLENKDFTYNYSIRKESTESATLLRNGTFTLGQNKYKTLEQSFSLPEPIEKTKFTVNIDNKKQSIHFWTEPSVQ